MTPRRHLIIPDAQIRPGANTEHVDWAARAIVEYQPDVIVCIGDWWDFPSLNSHNEPGSEELEGTRYQEDVEAGNEAFRRLCAPMQAEIDKLVQQKRKRWLPRKVFVPGNHEARADRVAKREPKWHGTIGSHNCETLDWERPKFLEIVEIDGIKYCHYFPSPLSGRPIGGTITSRLGHIGSSFVQGHQQGFLYGSKQYPDHVKHGLVCGRFYIDHEGYRPEDVQRAEWSGIVVLNEVRNGNYDLMPLSMDYLRRKFG
jgi:hypothetical protein